MPVEKILRAYIDKTVDEEVIEETIEKTVEENVAKQMEDKLKESQPETENTETSSSDIEINKVEKPILNSVTSDIPEKTATTSDSQNTKETTNTQENMENKNKKQNINLIINTPKTNETETASALVTALNTSVNKPDTKPVEPAVKSTASTTPTTPTRLSFNDNDSVLDMGTNKSTEVSAPKTVERLEKISKEQNEKRKLEEAEEDDEDDDEKITIMGDTSIKLDNLDIHSLDKEVKLEPNIILDDIEVLT